MAGFADSDRRTRAHKGRMFAARNIFVEEIHNHLYLSAALYFGHRKTFGITSIDPRYTRAVDRPFVVADSLVYVYGFAGNVPLAVFNGFFHMPVEGTVADSVDFAESMEFRFHIGLKTA